MTLKQRAQLYHDLGKMIGAGLHVDRSVELLLEQHPPTSMRLWLEGLRRGLAEHLTVSESVQRHADSVPLDVSLLVAGERGGRIEAAFEHLARYYDLRQKSRDKAITALIYPLILLHFGLVLPELRRFFIESSALAVVGRIALNIGLAWIILGGLALVGWWVVKLAATSPGVDRLLRAIPVLGGVSRHWALARFCQVFHTGLLAAFNMSETLQLAGDASQSARLRDAARSAASSLEAGGRLAGSMKLTGAFPKTFLQSVATAEETGTLDREMARWAVAEAELAARSQDLVAQWLPWLLYVFIMLYVAARVIGMVYDVYSPVLKMIDEM